MFPFLVLVMAAVGLQVPVAAPPASVSTPRVTPWYWSLLGQRLWLGPGLGGLTPARPDGPPVADRAAYDKLVTDTLREVHNLGADLFNTTKDFAGTYRLYQGALLTVRPLLGHHSAAQKLIDEGLAAAEKETHPAVKAFKLHETIEAVRAHLKAANAPAAKPKAAPRELAPPPREVKAPAAPRPPGQP